jgi:uncharacterized protein YjgD (DUF1641 family)
MKSARECTGNATRWQKFSHEDKKMSYFEFGKALDDNERNDSFPV